MTASPISAPPHGTRSAEGLNGGGDVHVDDGHPGTSRVPMFSPQNPSPAPSACGIRRSSSRSSTSKPLPPPTPTLGLPPLSTLQLMQASAANASAAVAANSLVRSETPASELGGDVDVEDDREHDAPPPQSTPTVAPTLCVSVSIGAIHALHVWNRGTYCYRATVTLKQAGSVSTPPDTSEDAVPERLESGIGSSIVSPQQLNTHMRSQSVGSVQSNRSSVTSAQQPRCFCIKILRRKFKLRLFHPRFPRLSTPLPSPAPSTPSSETARQSAAYSTLDIVQHLGTFHSPPVTIETEYQPGQDSHLTERLFDIPIPISDACTTEHASQVSPALLNDLLSRIKIRFDLLFHPAPDSPQPTRRPKKKKTNKSPSSNSSPHQLDATTIPPPPPEYQDDDSDSDKRPSITAWKRVAFVTVCPMLDGIAASPLSRRPRSTDSELSLVDSNAASSAQGRRKSRKPSSNMYPSQYVSVIFPFPYLTQMDVIIGARVVQPVPPSPVLTLASLATVSTTPSNQVPDTKTLFRRTSLHKGAPPTAPATPHSAYHQQCTLQHRPSTHSIPTSQFSLHTLRSTWASVSPTHAPTSLVPLTTLPPVIFAIHGFRGSPGDLATWKSHLLLRAHMLGGPVPIMHLVDVRTYPTVHAMATHVATHVAEIVQPILDANPHGRRVRVALLGFSLGASVAVLAAANLLSSRLESSLSLSVISLAGPHAGTAKWTQGVLKLVRPWPKMAPGVGGLLAGTCVDAWDRVVGELARGTSAVESVVMVGVRGDPLVPEASAVARVGAKDDDEETEASKVRRLVIVPVDGVPYESVDGAEMDSRSALDPGPLAEGRVDIMEVDTHAHAWPRLMTWASLSPAKRPQSATSNSSSGSGKRRPGSALDRYRAWVRQQRTHILMIENESAIQQVADWVFANGQ